MTDQLLTDARIATLANSQLDYGLIENGAIAIRRGRIVWAGPQSAVPSAYADIARTPLEGRLVTPGLIDCHTHVVFGGNRAAEFEMRLNGASYEEVARAGGGIISTVKATREASEHELVKGALPRVDAMLAEGVTTIEVKSGYGLDAETELRMLRAARAIAQLRPVRIVTTFLGAHAVPPEFKGRADAYLGEVCIPALRAAHAEGLVDAVDGFCEGIAFSTAQIARVFDVAKSLKLPVKLHAEQLSNLGGAKLAAGYGALSADHIEYLDEEGVASMAKSGTTAVILPGAFYTLRETQMPPIALLRQYGVPMALATDCNPGSSPMTSLLLAMNMGCTLFRMTPLEALKGVTVNAARALGLNDCGIIAAGQRADLAVWNVEHPAELSYRIGFNPLHMRMTGGLPTTTLTLIPGAVTLAELSRIYEEELAVVLDRARRPAMAAAQGKIAAAAAGNIAVYGVNTGFGKLASVKIASKDTKALQRNLILSHCCGVGPAIPRVLSRLMMALKLISLGRGASGVRLALTDLIEGMLAKGVTPVIPAQGSVGASGDLAPLAHMAAVMMGEGEAEFDGNVMPGADALAKAGLTPVVLGPKEGLALINGTQFSTAFALAGLFGAWRAAETALVTSALSTDAIMGSTAPLQPEIHALRGHAGQIGAASAMRGLLDGSEIRASHIAGDARVQDPYCIRCQPQVTGAAMDVLRMAARTLEIEANAATDNPLVLTDADMIVSGGNFHAEPVGFAADMIALAVAEIGAIAQRRVALIVDPVLSFNLPPFLTPNPGLNSGFMIAEVTTAALMSENKHLANPCVTDSTPTSANQEDHVSMAAHGARRLQRMVENLNCILGVELLCAAQGIGFRAPLKTSAPLQKVIARLRRDVPALGGDRYLAPDIERAAGLVKSGDIARAALLPLPGLAQ